MQTAFNQMKALMAMDVLCAYQTTISHFTFTLMHLIISLVPALCKKVNLLRIRAKKFNDTECNHSTVDKKLLSIVMTLCEF
jgi:hypothetical protein